MAEVNPPTRRKRPLIAALLTVIFLIVLFLRHDYWQWDEPGYLLFGFLPLGLWWQAGVCILASIMMALMVYLAWPAHLEQRSSP
jgi:hypothetical protein